MSPSTADRPRRTAALVVLGGLIGMAWYGQVQLIHSLAFLYQIAERLVPALSLIRGGP